MWSGRHQALRAALRDAGSLLHAATGVGPTEAAGPVARLRLALDLLRLHRAEVAAACGMAVRSVLPDLATSLESDQARLAAMIDRLLACAERSERAAAVNNGLTRAYDEFVAAYLRYLIRTERELWPAARAHLSEAEIRSWQARLAAGLTHPRALPFLHWTIGSCDDDALVAEIRAANDRCSPAVYATLSARARGVLGDARYERVLRSAGLGSQLDLPYTPTGAELIGDEEEHNLRDVIRRRRLWRYEIPSEQSYVARFEAEAERLLGVRHVHATVSGTVALQLALAALGVGPGDEVIIPDVTWVGCADAAIMCGAVPVPSRVDETLGLDAGQVERHVTQRTKAILAVSLYGNPCDVAGLRAVAERHRLSLVEDACQAAGVSYRGRRLGGHGDAAVFSTNFMKFVSAGDGGFIATNRDDIYAFAVAHTGGKTFPARKRHLKLSAPIIPISTLRMNELTGAVAVAQLRRLDSLLTLLRHARDQILTRVGDGRTFRRILGNDPEGDAGWCTPLLFDSEGSCQSFVAALRAQGIQHVSTARESFAGAEIHHCYPVMAAEQFIRGSGAHFAQDFPAMVAHASVDPRFNPWTHPRYGGDVTYPPGFMADSLAIVNRIAMIQTNPRLETTHCEVIARAIRAADDAVASRLGTGRSLTSRSIGMERQP